MAAYPIDAVITWVDGNDPEHRRKRLSYEKGGESRLDDVAGDIRYVSIGEIRYCVASILRFAPFVRKIFIVTDGQDPCLGDFIESRFPGSPQKSISLTIRSYIGDMNNISLSSTPSLSRQWCGESRV